MSVWPPESASTVTSSASGTLAASRACCSVIQPASTRSRSISAGAGDRKCAATSGRDTFAITRFWATTVPSGAATSPATR